jgi:hypothetical protein
MAFSSNSMSATATFTPTSTITATVTSTPTKLNTPTVSTGVRVRKTPGASDVLVSSIPQSQVANLPAALASKADISVTLTAGHIPYNASANAIGDTNGTYLSGGFFLPLLNLADVVGSGTGTTILHQNGAETEFGDGLNVTRISGSSVTIGSSLGITGGIFTGGAATIAGGGLLKATVGSESGGATYFSFTDSSGVLPTMWFTGGTAGDGRPNIHIETDMGCDGTLVWNAPATFSSAFHQGVTAVSSTPYTITKSDSFVYLDATSAGITVQLPAAVGNGRYLHLKKVDTSGNVVVFKAAAGETIDGSAAVTTGTPYAAIGLQDGASTKWWVH